MDKRDLRSQQDGLSADRGARPAAMFAVPHQRKLQPHQHHLRLVPLEGLSGNYRPQSRAGRNAADLRKLPQHNNLGECLVQPLHHRFPADRGPRPAAMLSVPRERQLQPDRYLLRFMPLEGLSGNYRPQSRAGWAAADLPELPQHNFVGKR